MQGIDPVERELVLSRRLFQMGAVRATEDALRIQTHKRASKVRVDQVVPAQNTIMRLRFASEARDRKRLLARMLEHDVDNRACR